MTQRQLGDKIGIQFRQIQKYETGASRIRAIRMRDIAVALDVPVAFFFEGLEAYLNDCCRYDAAVTSDAA